MLTAAKKREVIQYLQYTKLLKKKRPIPSDASVDNKIQGFQKKLNHIRYLSNQQFEDRMGLEMVLAHNLRSP